MSLHAFRTGDQSINTYRGSLFDRFCYEEIYEPLLVLLSLVDHKGIRADLWIDLHISFGDREMEGMGESESAFEKVGDGRVKGSPG